MRLRRDASALWVIDMQQRLLPSIDDWQRVLGSVIWLSRLARELSVPVLVSEQYPQGLGPTHADLLAELPGIAVAEKLSFSCLEDNCFQGYAAADTRQVVVCGVESHVCVLQTVLDLLAQQREVFVVADAVGSRSASDKALALERLRHAGAVMVSREMVGYEWLSRAGSDEFRRISRNFLK